uniref:Phosphate acyltransferase n=1 Tax=Anthurium amnicola TaxID=1678845 RepID=A0A1D1YKR8_9ARAE
MATPSTVNHQEVSIFADTWNGSEDEDYKAFLELQMDYCDANMDPLHEIFMEHLREDGQSYILEMTDGDHGLPVFVKYEGENEDIDSEPRRSSQNISDHRKRHSANKFSRVNVIPSKESVETRSPLDSKSRLKTTYSLVDESYQTFLRHVRFEDFSMMLDWESRIIRYEEPNGASNASEWLTTESALCHREQGLVPYRSPHCGSHESEVDDSPTVTCNVSDPSQFKRQLNAILNQSFDQNEYERLLKAATDRKPLNKQKHLRSMSISYATNLEGMSYLDHQPDLAEKLQSVEPHKGLELLRGFFFWLQNLCHEGAFMPWLSDDSNPPSSDTLPTSGYELMPLNDARDDIQDALPSATSGVEFVVGSEAGIALIS